jgi:polysaccharide biosynthesis/export protein
MPNKLTRSLFVCSLLAGLCLAQGTSTGEAASPGHFTPREDRYRLRPSDVLDLVFSFTPEYNQTVTIQPDGFVSLKDAGDLKLGGLTSEEATAALTAKYSTTLYDPSITLTLKEFSKPSFIVAGEVTKPGKYELHGDITLTDAIAIAGGFVTGAKQSEVLLFRRVQPDLAEVKKFNVKHMLADGRLKEDPMLRPGDSIYISKSAVGKIDTFMKVSRLGLYFPLP